MYFVPMIWISVRPVGGGSVGVIVWELCCGALFDSSVVVVASVVVVVAPTVVSDAVSVVAVASVLVDAGLRSDVVVRAAVSADVEAESTWAKAGLTIIKPIATAITRTPNPVNATKLLFIYA
jgi:hypothetical protein